MLPTSGACFFDHSPCAAFRFVKHKHGASCPIQINTQNDRSGQSRLKAPSNLGGSQSTVTCLKGQGQPTTPTLKASTVKTNTAYSSNIVEGAGHSWNPGLFVDVSWNGRPVKTLTATKSQEPWQNFVKGIFAIFDALTSYKRFVLTPFLHTPFI